MEFKTNVSKLANLEFDDCGRRYEDFVHQGSYVGSYINDFRERNRAITNPIFRGRPFEMKKKGVFTIFRESS